MRAGKGGSGTLPAAIGAIGWWYLFLLIPTVAFHAHFLRVGVRDNTFGGLLDAVARRGGAGWPRSAAGLLRFFRADAVELAILVPAAYLVGHVLLRLPRAWVIGGGTCIALLLLAANYLATVEVRSLITTELLGESVSWATGHPDVLGRVVTPRKLALFLVLGLWPVGLLLLLRRRDRPRWPPALDRGAVALSATLVGAALLAPGPVLAPFGSESTAGRGYWVQTALALWNIDRHDAQKVQPESRGQLLARYRAVAYPGGRAPTAEPLVRLAAADLVPRHIVVIALETAPRKYYPIIDNPAFPGFLRMGRHGIVSEHHYTNGPFTTRAIYGIASGTYPKPGRFIVDYGDFSTDGIAATFGHRGYETTFIDSYRIEWDVGVQNRRELIDLGFTRLLEASVRRARGESYFGLLADREHQAFERAAGCVLGAQAHGRKALVLLATALGHFGWPAPPDRRGRPAAERIGGIAHVLDGEIAGLLDAFDRAGLRDSVIVVAVGDHGLRYLAEFQAVGEPMRPGDLAFNVPFLLYAPGIFRTQVRLPYITSHIDIAPTLFQLTGIATDSLLLHGESMLDRRLQDRVTFMLNAQLSPVDAFDWYGRFVTVDHLSGQVTVEPPALGVAAPATVDRRLAGAFSAALLQQAGDAFTATAAYFLRR
ncbi:MAG TPA: sulfatase-like hydrolase/transferase [Gemmatimonadales bacterium]|nr:sulfatase-like hydrolase/transferase [Gemmatimonadales bacterium]